MRMFVGSTTLHEATNGRPRFPTRLRALITQCIQQITTDELNALLAEHEADPCNLDRRIEASLRKLDPSLDIRANCRISRGTNFNSDLVIEADDAIVCLEIEKGDTSRFELDILKMMVFACQRGGTQAGKPAYGAFIVPTDNLVARHISGNAKESSYQYLCRLFRLVAEVEPTPLADILVVGYGTSRPRRRRRRTRGQTARASGPEAKQVRRGTTRPAKRGSSLTHEPTEAAIKAALVGYPLATVLKLRAKLKQACPDVREKLNSKTRYLGYAVGTGGDRLYVYVQKHGLVLDLDIPKERAGEVRAKGFEVRERNNYQSKAGWLTGLRVPHDLDTTRLDEVPKLALDALR